MFYKDGFTAQINNGTPQSLLTAQMESVVLIIIVQIALQLSIMQVMFILLKQDIDVQQPVSLIQSIWLLPLVQICKVCVEQKAIHF